MPAITKKTTYPNARAANGASTSAGIDPPFTKSILVKQ